MSKKFDFKDLLSFEVTFIPKVASICYLVMVGISVLSGFIIIILGIAEGLLAVALVGLLVMIILPLFIRLWFEVMLIFFKIYDRLNDINNKLDKLPESTDITRK